MKLKIILLPYLFLPNRLFWYPFLIRSISFCFRFPSVKLQVWKNAKLNLYLLMKYRKKKFLLIIMEILPVCLILTADAKKRILILNIFSIPLSLVIIISLLRLLPLQLLNLPVILTIRFLSTEVPGLAKLI